MESKANSLRNSGISVVGDLPWGSHFCHFYETRQDLLDTLVPYFKAGLESREYCLWVVSTADLLTVAEAKHALAQAVPDLDRHLSDGNIEIFDGPEWYLEESAFNLERVTSAWNAKLKRALDRGYDGLRISGDTCWLTERDRKDFCAYERQLNDSISGRPMTVLCSYPVENSTAAELLDVVHTHQFAIARRQGEWEVIETPDVIRAKAEVTRLNDELEQRVAERTAQLAKALKDLNEEVSERGQSEVELGLAHQRLSYHFENTPLAVIEWDKDLFIKRWSKRAEEVFGWKASEAIGMNLWDAQPAILYEEDAQAVGLIADQLLQGVVDRNLSINRNYTKDHKVIYCEWYNSVLRDEDGNVITIVSLVHDVTTRKLADEALKLFRSLLDQSLDAIEIIDPATLRFLDCNQSAYQTLGYTREEFLALSVFDIDPTLDEELLARSNHELETRGGFVFESLHRRKDGSIFPVEVSLKVARLERVYRLAVVRDITERKRAEEALRKSEDRLRLVIDTIPTMVWSISPDGTLDFVNQPCLDYSGLTWEQFAADPTGRIHPGDRARALEGWLGRLAAGECYEEEMRLLRADGTYRWFLIRTDALRDETGAIFKWYGVSTDINERKEAEEKLKQSESLLAEAQRLAQVGSWDWDLRTNVVTWSDQLYKVFGLQPGAVQTRGDALPFIHPEDRDLVQTTVTRSVEHKEAYNFYYRVIRPDGEERIVHSRGQLLSDENGEPIKVIGATQDVTELKRTEERLRATTAQLRALSESVLKAKEEEAKRIARELHDELGSTLATLKWSLLGLENVGSDTGPEPNEQQAKIVNMVELVDATIHSVRRISGELRPGALDDLGLISAIRLHARHFEENSGMLCLLSSNVEVADLNQDQATCVFRVFQEATTNILRHSRATEVNILIEDEDEEFVLEIRDNGTGITEDEKRGARSLGLLGMRERAHTVGGTVQITGVEGEGTIVSVHLPKST